MALRREYDEIRSSGMTTKKVLKIRIYGSYEELKEAVPNLWEEFPEGVFSPFPGGIQILIFEGGRDEFDIKARGGSDSKSGRGDKNPNGGRRGNGKAPEGKGKKRPKDSGAKGEAKGLRNGKLWV